MLDDDAIARYARQIVIPGVGAAGQEKLLRSTVLVVGDPRGVATASLYLRAAGVGVVTAWGSSLPDVALVAGVEALSASERERLTAAGPPVCWYAIDGDSVRSGVHPEAPLPCLSSSRRSRERDPVHDAAACDAASVACALLLGLATARGDVLVSGR